MNRALKLARLEDVGTIEQTEAPVELPVSVRFNVYDSIGGFYEHHFVDANDGFIFGIITPDPSEGQEAHERSQKQAEFIRDRINGKAKG